MSKAHRLVNPPTLPPPVGFAHAVVAAPGRVVYLGGQVGHDAHGRIVDADLVAQFDQALGNVLEALSAAGGRPDHIVSLQIFVTDVAAYRASLEGLGAAWRRRLGRHYPAVGLFGISELFDPEARVELMAIAVVPE